MKPRHTEVQIGKNGISEGSIEIIKNNFIGRESIKIVLLKSSPERNMIQEAAEKIISALGKNYTYRIVGFTISVRKWRKARS